MRILLVSPLPPPNGGISTWTTGYVNWCQNNKETDVEIVNTAVGNYRANSFETYSVTQEIKRNLRILKQVGDKLKSFEPDIIHINSSCGRNGLIKDYLIAKKAKHKKVKIILHCHCDVEVQANSKSALLLLKKVLKLSDKVIVLNTSSKKFVDNLCGISSKIVPNFIDGVNIVPKECVSELKNILFAGRLIKTKGIREIYEAADYFKDLSFNLVGSISPEIEILDKPDNVNLYGDKTRSEVIDIMRSNDIFLFPSYTEGFPGVILEAMITGLPIISTDVGAVRDILEDNGIYVKVGDVQGIIDAIKNLEDVVIRQKLSDWNLKKTVGNYLPEAVIPQYINIYNEALND